MNDKKQSTAQAIYDRSAQGTPKTNNDPMPVGDACLNCGEKQWDCKCSQDEIEEATGDVE